MSRFDKKRHPDQGMWTIFAVIYIAVALVYGGIQLCT
jgi:hypothetical protein